MPESVVLAQKSTWYTSAALRRVFSNWRVVELGRRVPSLGDIVMPLLLDARGGDRMRACSAAVLYLTRKWIETLVGVSERTGYSRQYIVLMLLPTLHFDMPLSPHKCGAVQQSK